MTKKIILFILFISSFSIYAADKIKGYAFDETKEPVIGANIYWEKSKKGTVTDIDGYFEIDAPTSHEHLIVSYTGYSTQSLHLDSHDKELTIHLKEDLELQEVVISSRNPGTIANRTSVLQEQKITYAEICRAACCNLGESFETNPSVDVAYSDATTGAKQIKLLGLAGTYVQMLSENYPNFRGVASPFGLDYVPGAWMDGIYISKGTSSVKNGYEALAGQINVEYKKPTTADLLSLNLFANDAQRMEVNADGSWRINDKLSTGLLVHYSNDKKGHDDNDDAFLDYPKTEMINLMNRWNYESGKYMSQYGGRFIHEERTGGQDPSQVINNPYQISLKTNRGELFTKQAYIINDGELAESIAFIASGSIHDQESMFDTKQYDVTQKNLYASLIYEKEFSHKHNLSTGLSLNYDEFKEQLETTEYNRREAVPGVYAQYTYNLNEKLILLAGLRADYSSIHGAFVTPRLHLKYNPYEWVHLRGSVGKGYRTANILAENNYLLASSRAVNIATNLDQEEAWNAGLNATFYIPIAGKQLTLIGEYYQTNFKNQVVVDMDSNPHAINFYNLGDGKSYTNSSQIEMSYPFFEGFTFTAAYRWTNSTSDYTNQETGEVTRLKKPLLNDYKGLATASYQTPKGEWQFDLTGQFNGGGRMPTPDAMTPLWDETFGSHTVVNSQITKYFTNWNIYIGVENLFNYRQDNPIVDAANPRSDNFDATMIWGPVHGRKIYGGLRFTIPHS
ncbi:MAG: TonB-dependent receptor [Bacteroidales bacterium]|nr:TonB-dependent receptor [Bacteroidales bacterium]